MALRRRPVPWRTLAAAGVLAATVPGPVTAQDQPRAPDARPWFVSAAKWVKWPTLAAAIGLTAAAITRKADADAYFDRLQTLCIEQPDDCQLSTSGTYTNPQAEDLYQDAFGLAIAKLRGGELRELAPGELRPHPSRTGPGRPHGIARPR